MKSLGRFVSAAIAVGIVIIGVSYACRDSSKNHTPPFVKTLQPNIEAFLAEALVPGAAVLVQSPEFGTWHTTFGTRERDHENPVSIHDHVRIGSNTKTMTGTLILQLVQEGLLKLDDPIAKFHAQVPNGDDITIAHLLSMRSGLPNYSETLQLNEDMDKDPEKIWQPEQLLNMAFEQPILFEPGTKYYYSNTNTILLGLVVEKLTQKPIEEVMQDRIFKPLGLSQTVFPPLASNAIPIPFPRGYQYGTNVETLKSQVLPPEIQAAARAGTYAPIDATNMNPSWAWTAGAGISTAFDLAVYVQALVEGGLLTPDMQKQRMESIVPTDPDNPAAAGYGYALARMGPMYGHTGELPGYNSFMGYDPIHKITIVTWTSLAASPDGKAPAVELAKLIINELYGQEGGVKAPSASHNESP